MSPSLFVAQISAAKRQPVDKILCLGTFLSTFLGDVVSENKNESRTSL
jgi:hypothetical protein